MTENLSPALYPCPGLYETFLLIRDIMQLKGKLVIRLSNSYYDEKIAS